MCLLDGEPEGHATGTVSMLVKVIDIRETYSDEVVSGSQGSWDGCSPLQGVQYNAITP